MSINIDELTIGQAKELATMLGHGQPAKATPFQVGQAVFIRTVTYHYTGRVVGIVGDFVELAEAAWIADSGRFADALKTGDLDEVEPYPNSVYVSLASIVDWCKWRHDLPRVQS